MAKVSDVVSAIDRAAPFSYQSGWDNSGLQLGDPQATVARLLVALDPTPCAVREARRRRAECLVTHHPLFFENLRQLSAATPVGGAALGLAAAGVSLIAAHTNYDAAHHGLNDLLGRRLGLAEMTPLDKQLVPGPACGAQILKLVTFVPEADLAGVERAIYAAGAGQIGDYTECGFRTHGSGTFIGGPATRPTVGRRGRREEVAEVRLETVVPAERADAVIRALRAAHSYEEPSYSLFPTAQPSSTIGLGRVGTLRAPLTIDQLAALVKRALGVKTVELIAPPRRRPAGKPATTRRSRAAAEATLRQVAVIGGSGGSLWSQALRSKAEALITGEMKHHDRLAAREAGLIVVLAGHYATERPAVAGLATILRAALPSVKVFESEDETDPTVWR